MWENYLLYVHLAAANLGLLLGPLASFTQNPGVGTQDLATYTTGWYW